MTEGSLAGSGLTLDEAACGDITGSFGATCVVRSELGISAPPPSRRQKVGGASTIPWLPASNITADGANIVRHRGDVLLSTCSSSASASLRIRP